MASISRLGLKWRAQLYHRGQRTSRVFSTECEAKRWAEYQHAILMASDTDSSLIPRRVLDAARTARYTADDVVGACVPVPSRTGVYFLIRNARITYVGQTRNLFQRLWKHQRTGRRFDSFAFIPCAAESLDSLEATYISAFLPPENRSLGISA